MSAPVSVSGQPELSLIILCYRAEGYIPECVALMEEEVRRLGVSYEIVVVANYVEGSADRSPEIAQALAARNPNVKVVAQPKQGMMGWDMHSGLDAATGRVLAIIDGDGQISAGDVSRTYRELCARRLDLCQTYRVRREDGWKRMVISRFFNAIFAVLFPGTGLHDVNAKPKLLTREAYARLDLQSTDWFADAEIIIQARRHRLTFGEVRSVFGKSAVRPSFIDGAAIREFIKNLLASRLHELRQRRPPRPGQPPPQVSAPAEANKK